MWKWTQARRTNGSRGDKEANEKTDAQLTPDSLRSIRKNFIVFEGGEIMYDIQ
ncbi:hypothetical protein HanXRQr2_Chr05g0204221 [Helianthus annuus]|uniref:Uncharacterized protein n=1 Tax=Helianthus annuus TaxID=4232 RepID=A0A9K3IYE8_HELAN|nr:hypothetical protein HanXRQr2_Chr05g0204221 [Helianthus annuus]